MTDRLDFDEVDQPRIVAQDQAMERIVEHRLDHEQDQTDPQSDHCRHGDTGSAGFSESARGPQRAQQREPDRADVQQLADAADRIGGPCQ